MENRKTFFERKKNRLFLPNLYTIVIKNCVLLITIFCALLPPDYKELQSCNRVTV
jgi:hypothetical protein